MFVDPALRCPPEIVCTIFEHCLVRSGTRPAKSSPTRAPLLLAQICHRWRELCLHWPSLWSSVAFHQLGSVALLKLWIERSRNHPLTLDIVAIDDTLGDAYMDELVGHFERWKDVSVMFPSLDRFCDYRGPFPVLTQLYVDAISPSGGQLPRFEVLQAPRLRSASIPAVTSATVNLPFAQLTSLHFDELEDAEAAVAMVKHCPRLQHFACVTHRHTVDAPIVPSASIYTHNCLSSLYVVPETMAYLTLPRLERIRLESYGAESLPCTTNLLPQLIARSGCDLQFLALYVSRQTTPRSLQDLLYHNPITHLSLRFGSSSVLQLITVLDVSGVAPQLKNLELHNRYHDWNNFGPLLSALTARAESGLRSFKLHLDGVSPTPFEVIPDAQMDQFRALANTRLEMLITCAWYEYDGLKTSALLGTLPELRWWADF
ncbi:hypothetical protein C8F01DRAFT_484450 [Mycena amicta]|nr:hypothetical protein C8F01DRAFT_484450 [Mycena amicta]